MTTPAQGKGKKKNKEVTKVSLDEFTQLAAPHGHSVVSLKMTGLDWAETMADYDQKSAGTQQIIVPAAPRAQRGPDVDFDSLPNEPPFRVSVFNLPMSVDEKEIHDRFFQGLDVKRVEISKASTTVEFGNKQDLFDALSKDGFLLKNRTVNVCLYGTSPQNMYNSDRYGGRGGAYGDRYGDRSGGPGASRLGDRYGDRSSGGFNRDRDNQGGFTRSGGFGAQRERFGDGFGDRGNFRDSNRSRYTAGGGELSSSEESMNWRARPATVNPPPPSQPSRPLDSGEPQRQSYRGFGGPRVGGERFADRPGGFSRDRDNQGGFNRGSGGFGQRGYGERYRDNGRTNRFTSGGGEPSSSEESMNWRERPSTQPSSTAPTN